MQEIGLGDCEGWLSKSATHRSGSWKEQPRTPQTWAKLLSASSQEGKIQQKRAIVVWSPAQGLPRAFTDWVRLTRVIFPTYSQLIRNIMTSAKSLYCGTWLIFDGITGRRNVYVTKRLLFFLIVYSSQADTSKTTTGFYFLCMLTSYSSLFYILMLWGL